MSVKCTRPGCQSDFDPSNNPQNSCYFHTGAPLFHDGLKGWNCCKPRVTSFDDFLTLRGCTSGTHSNEPQVTPKPVVTAPGAPQNNPAAPTKTPNFAPTQVPTQVPIKTPATPPAKETPKPIPVKELEDDLTLQVPENATCRRRGCGTKYVDEQTSRKDEEKAKCVYHPGLPVFHEGSKGYTCCSRKVLEFDEFLRLEGCSTLPQHRFLDQQTAEGEQTVELRTDWYQTPSTVILSVFGKKSDKSASKVNFTETEVSFDLRLPEGKVYRKTMQLSQPIIPEQCSYEILTTKVEITLRKGNGISWASIEPSENAPKTWTTFGVSGGMGTTGSKEMFLANDAPLYAARK